MMRDGVEQALVDAESALEQLPPESLWIPTALLGRGVAHALLGATDRATDDLDGSYRTCSDFRLRGGAYAAQAQLALLAAAAGCVGRGRETRTGRASRRRGRGSRGLLEECDGTRRDGACRRS